MMEINQLAEAFHQNAVDHGFWDEPVPAEQAIALIHAEWSEALEEHRAGRLLVYCTNPDCGILAKRETSEEVGCRVCGFRDGKAKPEGTAMELIDGCIRILDYIGFIPEESRQAYIKKSKIVELMFDLDRLTNMLSEVNDWTLPMLVANLHAETSAAFLRCVEDYLCITNLLRAVGMALAWIKANGLDPETLMMAKHNYNKTRPRKHGKAY